MRWQILIGCLAALWFAAPATGYAQPFVDVDETEPSIMSYGFHGLWTGAQLGLATGYLSTGDDYDDEEWKNLALGVGIGAVGGIGAGLLLGTADHAGGDAPGTGYFILRDMGYGTTLGALGGAAVGTIMWIADEPGKSIPQGAAIGSLVGAGLGIVFGVIEGSEGDTGVLGAREKDDDVETSQRTRLRFTLAAMKGSLIPVPAVQGQF